MAADLGCAVGMQTNDRRTVKTVAYLMFNVSSIVKAPASAKEAITFSASSYKALRTAPATSVSSSRLQTRGKAVRTATAMKTQCLSSVKQAAGRLCVLKTFIPQVLQVCSADPTAQRQYSRPTVLATDVASILALKACQCTVPYRQSRGTS